MLFEVCKFLCVLFNTESQMLQVVCVCWVCYNVDVCYWKFVA